MGAPKDQEATNQKRKDTLERNRTNAGASTGAAETMQLGSGSRDPNADARPPRVSMHGGLKLSTGSYKLDQESYAYRWFADNPDNPGRIETAKAAYWEHCSNDQNSNITKPSGADTLYLMRLERQWWEEDQVLKAKTIQDKIRKESKLGADEYSPQGRGSAIHLSK